MADDWQSFDSRKKADYLLDSGELSDCSFILDDGSKFKCHKFVLACNSPYFKKLLYGDFKEAKSLELKDIALKEVNSSDFERFIKWAYYDDQKELQTLSAVELLGLLDLGKMYLARALVNAIQNVFEMQLNKFNNNELITLFQYSYENSEDALKQRCGEKITQRAKEAMKTQQQNTLLDLFTCAEIFALKWPIFYEFLLLLRANVGEKVRFNIIDAYIKANELSSMPSDAVGDGESAAATASDFAGNQATMHALPNDAISLLFKERILGKAKLFSNKDIVYILIHSIDYKKMTADEFMDGPGKSDLLDGNEKYAFFSEIYKLKYRQTWR